MSATTSEAVKAAARALVMSSPSNSVQYDDLPPHRQEAWDVRASAALSAAYPLMAAQAKAEALKEAADDLPVFCGEICYAPIQLRERAATIEGKDS